MWYILIKYYVKKDIYPVPNKKAYSFTEVLDFTEKNMEGKKLLQSIKERK